MLRQTRFRFREIKRPYVVYRRTWRSRAVRRAELRCGFGCLANPIFLATYKSYLLTS